MNRFDLAEKVMTEMEVSLFYDDSPYAVGLRAVLAALLDDDELETRLINVGYGRAGVADEEPARLLLRTSGEAWLIVDEADPDENRRFSSAVLVRAHAEATLRILGDGQPSITFTHPDGTSIIFAWRSIAAFEKDEDGVFNIFRSWVRPC